MLVYTVTSRHSHHTLHCSAPRPAPGPGPSPPVRWCAAAQPSHRARHLRSPLHSHSSRIDLHVGCNCAAPNTAGPGRRGSPAGRAGMGWPGLAGRGDSRLFLGLPGAGCWWLGWHRTAHLRTTSPSDPRPLACAQPPKIAPDKNVTDIILSSSCLVSLSSYSI